MTAEEKRQAAYLVEADPDFNLAMKYHAAADGLKALGDYNEAARLEQKANALKESFALKRKEIQERIPDERYCLNASGAYHLEGCSYVTEGGERLTLAELKNRDGVRPCARCQPPPPTNGQGIECVG